VHSCNPSTRKAEAEGLSGDFVIPCQKVKKKKREKEKEMGFFKTVSIAFEKFLNK
jgi:hypothetical protein